MVRGAVGCGDVAAKDRGAVGCGDAAAKDRGAAGCGGAAAKDRGAVGCGGVAAMGRGAGGRAGGAAESGRMEAKSASARCNLGVITLSELLVSCLTMRASMTSMMTPTMARRALTARSSTAERESPRS